MQSSFDRNAPDNDKVKILNVLFHQQKLPDLDTATDELFNRISLNQEASERIQATASLYKAVMRFHRRTEVIDDATAYTLLDEVRQNQAVTAKAKTLMKKLKHQGRV